ncbi:hypothetical protein [Nocardia sp. CY41]|nr:hypothetical protein [Nocardia sp. CY41]
MIFPFTPRLGVRHAERCHTDRLPENEEGRALLEHLGFPFKEN